MGRRRRGKKRRLASLHNYIFPRKNESICILTTSSITIACHTVLFKKWNFEKTSQKSHATATPIPQAIAPESRRSHAEAPVPGTRAPSQMLVWSRKLAASIMNFDSSCIVLSVCEYHAVLPRGICRREGFHAGTRRQREQKERTSWMPLDSKMAYSTRVNARHSSPLLSFVQAILIPSSSTYIIQMLVLEASIAPMSHIHA